MVACLVAYKAGQDAEEGRVLTKELAIKESEIKIQIAHLEFARKVKQNEEEIAEKWREADRLYAASQAAEKNKLSIEENRIAVEVKRLGFQSGVSGNDTYLAAMRFVHEQQIAEAELIRSFSDKLLSESERERSFAVFILSAYISPEVISRLAAGGEDIISTKSLEKLAAIDGYQISDVAQSILARRKANDENVVRNS